jgi:hypothetical protein
VGVHSYIAIWARPDYYKNRVAAASEQQERAALMGLEAAMTTGIVISLDEARRGPQQLLVNVHQPDARLRDFVQSLGQPLQCPISCRTTALSSTLLLS